MHLDHDAAGNMTFDGLHAFQYDAWNRLVSVSRAYIDAGNSSQVDAGSAIAAIAYDGLGRRISKAVSSCGDWDGVYHYFYGRRPGKCIRGGVDRGMGIAERLRGACFRLGASTGWVGVRPGGGEGGRRCG